MKFNLKNKPVYSILFWLLSSVLFAQNDDINHQKYWYYRTRLVNDFVKVGLNVGESIPFYERASGQHGNPAGFGFGGGVFQDQNGLAVGDAISSVAIYIAALATEYALLKQSNQSTVKVVHELFCALNAVNRLDYYAETNWGSSPDLNGFMIRDDIPCSFLSDNYTHFNYYNNGVYATNNPSDLYYPNYFPDNPTGAAATSTMPALPPDRGFTSIVKTGQYQSTSDYCGLQKNHDPDNHTMSQDHFISLLVGLSLVNKYVDNVSDNFTPFPYDPTIIGLKDEAKRITDRTVNLFRNDPHHVWNLSNPVTGVYVNAGFNTLVTQYGIAESSCRAVGISNVSSPYVPIVSGGLVPNSCAYVDFVPVQSSGFGFYTAWIQTPPTSGDNASFMTHLLATGYSGWVPGVASLGATICTQVCGSSGFFSDLCLFFLAPVCLTPIPVPAFDNATDDVLVHVLNSYIPGRLDKWDYIEHPLLYQALSGNSINYLAYLNPVKSILNSAPCSGTYNFGQNARPDYEWSSDNRIEHIERREQLVDATKLYEDFPGEYNGVDYMLIHNLYRLVGNTNYPVVDLSDRYINFTLPTNGNVEFTCPSQTPCQIGAFETIVADNTINSNGNITYRAGKTLNFGSNFHVANGANFHAWISPFICLNSSYIRAADNSSSQSFSGYDDMGSFPTHYVDYSTQTTMVTQDLQINPTKSALVKNEIQNILLSVDNTLQEARNYLNVYPNPSNDEVNIEFTVYEKETVTIELINALGQTMVKEMFVEPKQNKYKISMAQYGPGLYSVHFTSDKGRTNLKKIVIN